MNNDNEPSLIFIFTLQQWRSQLHPLTKIDIVDIAPLISKSFYYDNQIKSYVFIILKNQWDSLEGPIKRKFMSISRRAKEEIETPMTTEQRENYENSDLFKIYVGNDLEKKNSPQTELDLSDIINKLDN